MSRSVLLACVLLVGLSVGVTAFDASFATSLMSYAGASYCTDHAITSWSCSYCNAVPALSEIQVFYSSSTDMRGYVGVSSSYKAIIVSFKGTNAKDLRDWIDDLSFKQAPTPFKDCPGCTIHTGFFTAYESVGQIGGAIAALTARHPGYPVWVTGHSLGAAVAVVATFDLISSYKITPSLLLNFGQPRVGNAALASALASRMGKNYMRVTHNKDPVIHLPLSIMGFQHSQFEIFFDEPNVNYKECVGNEDKQCADQFLLALSIEDHLSYMNVSNSLTYDPSCTPKSMGVVPNFRNVTIDLPSH